MRGLWSDHFPPAASPPPPLTPSPLPEGYRTAEMRGLCSDHFPPAASLLTPLTPSPLPEDYRTAEMRGLYSEPQPPTTSPIPSTPTECYERCLICPICDAACRLLTSFTQLNPNRKFYICQTNDHKFFKWVDTVNPSEFIDVPYCGGCFAGVCRVRKERSGPNAGRILFMCKIKEGEGSCGYRVWQDELEMLARKEDESIIPSPSTATDCPDSSTIIVDLVEESTENDEAADNELNAIDNTRHVQGIGAAFGEMEKIICLEENSHQSSRRPPKRSRHGDLKGSLISAGSLTLHQAKNSASVQHCWMEAAICQNLGAELQGWWGRLNFHPTPSLIIQASCYVSPTTMDSVCRVPGKAMVNSNSLSAPTRSLLEVQSYSNPRVCNADLIAGAEAFHAALDIPSSSNNFLEPRFQNVMPDLISKGFGQLAVHLQNELLTVLETMDVLDPEAMNWEAKATFAALDRLMFDHQDLKEHTQEFIRCTRTLSEIEQSMPRNDSYEKLLDHCSSERLRLDEISHIHAKTVQTVTTNKNCLKVLQEKITSTKDWLSQIETELSLCEAEMRPMELELDNISKCKDNLEGQYLTAAKELEESQRLREFKKAEHDAAKAAFDRARASLRGYRCTK